MKRFQPWYQKMANFSGIHEKLELRKEIEAVRGVVYFVCAMEAGAVKIGYCSDPRKLRARLDDLQVGNHCELRLIRIVRGLNNTERWFHNQFKELHIRGEWHQFDRRMLSLPPPTVQDTGLTPLERALVNGRLREKEARAAGLAKRAKLHPRCAEDWFDEALLETYERSAAVYRDILTGATA